MEWKTESEKGENKKGWMSCIVYEARLFEHHNYFHFTISHSYYWAHGYKSLFMCIGLNLSTIASSSIRLLGFLGAIGPIPLSESIGIYFLGYFYVKILEFFAIYIIWNWKWQDEERGMMCVW